MAKQFSVIPTEDDLAKLGRDLHFYEVENSQPSVLTASQIATYNRDGYLAPIRIFSDDEILVIRTYFDDLLKRVMQIGRAHV